MGSIKPFKEQFNLSPALV